MTDTNLSPSGDVEGGAVTSTQTPVKPSLRARLRPLELLGLAAAFAAFAGIVAAIVLHPWGDVPTDIGQAWLIVLIIAGAAFVVSLVTLAMLALGGYEPPKEPPSNVLGGGPSH